MFKKYRVPAVYTSIEETTTNKKRPLEVSNAVNNDAPKDSYEQVWSIGKISKEFIDNQEFVNALKLLASKDLVNELSLEVSVLAGQIGDSTKGLVKRINDLDDNKQNKRDDILETQSKMVTGAINEVFELAKRGASIDLSNYYTIGATNRKIDEEIKKLDLSIQDNLIRLKNNKGEYIGNGVNIPVPVSEVDNMAATDNFTKVWSIGRIYETFAKFHDLSQELRALATKDELNQLKGQVDTKTSKDEISTLSKAIDKYMKQLWNDFGQVQTKFNSDTITKKESLGDTGRNLNDVRVTGFYEQPYNVDALLSLNYPIDRAGVLIVVRGEHIFQFYQSYAQSNRFFSRQWYNGEWSQWRDFSNADTIKGRELMTSGKYVSRIPVNGGDNVMEIGRWLDFHNGDDSADYNGRLGIDDNFFLFSSTPFKSHEIHTQYIVMPTYGNGDYGPSVTVTYWLDNRNGIKRLILDNVLELLIPMGKVLAKDFIHYSDKRIKKVFLKPKKMNSDLENLLSIEPKLFSFLDDENQAVHYGFLAQDVAPSIPTAVSTIKYADSYKNSPRDEKGNIVKDLKGVNSMDLLATAWGAIRELSGEVTNLKKEITLLKNQIKEGR